MTSVDRDDLADGGARHFARTVAAIRRASPKTTIEVLTPDFLRKEGALEAVVAAGPDAFDNLETVPSKYLTVRPGARYFASLRLLQRAKELDLSLFTKSGIMVGLGEERNEVLQLMDDMRAAGVDFLTIGQYLQPTPKHHAVERFVLPEDRGASPGDRLCTVSVPCIIGRSRRLKDFGATQCQSPPALRPFAAQSYPSLGPAHPIQDPLNCLRSLTGDRPNGSVGRAALPHGLHAFDHRHLGGVGDHALDVSILHDVVTEWARTAAEHAL